MNAAVFLLGFLNVALSCAFVILVAFVMIWVLGKMKVDPSGDVMKWGKIVVGLICLIIIVSWLLSVIGLAQPLAPHLLR